jgi:lambda family phage tail tape measure protein
MTDAVSGLHRAQQQQQLDFSDDASAAADAYRQLTDPALKYAQTMRVLNEIIAKFPELQREATRAAIDAQIALLETQTTAAAGIERGLLKIKQQISDTGTLAETALVNAFTNAKDALLDFFTTGKLSMTDFVQSLQRDLADLALSGLLTKTLGAALGLGGKDSGAGGISNFLSGLFSNGGEAAQPTTVNVPQFATGGAFNVGGTGGVDSQMVAFRASPGERVTVQTPAQQARGRRPANVTINVVTPDAQSFQRAQGSILARTQRQLDRASRRDG